MMAKSYAAFYDLQLQLHLGTFGREYTSLVHGWLAKSLSTVTAKARSCESCELHHWHRRRTSFRSVPMAGSLPVR